MGAVSSLLLAVLHWPHDLPGLERGHTELNCFTVSLGL